MAAPERINPWEFLASQTYIVIAVIDEHGKPWAVPVALRRYEQGVVEWVSHVDSLHSRAIANNPEVAVTAFTPKRDQGDDYGLYLRARAEKSESMQDGFAVYRAKIYEAWYNDHKHIKTHIDIQEV